jgi:tellurite resistance protein
VQLNGGTPDAPARILLDTGYFIAALVAIQAPALFRLPFAISFWALSFPLAALATASFRFAGLADSTAHRGLRFLLLGLLALTIAMLIAQTIRAALRREICQPE